MNPSTQLFQSLIAEKPPDFDKILLFVLQHPLLLSSKEIMGLLDKINMDFWADKTHALGILKQVIAVQKEIVENKTGYPFGAGPLEKIYTPVKNGEMPVETACERAVQLQMYTLLSPIYINGVTDATELFVRQNPGEWLRCVNFLKILLASLEACPAPERDKEYSQMWSSAVESWVAVAGMALHDVPDGRLFSSALQYGSKLAEEKLASDKPGSAWILFHRLGVLHLDPYFAGRSVSNYTVQYNKWQDRLTNYFGKDVVTINEATIWMPAPKEALARAEYYFAKAIDISSGINKARSCKALAETYNWKHELQQEDVLDKVLLYSQQALALFVPPENYLQETTALVNLVNSHSAEIPATAAPENNPEISFLLTASLEDILAKYDVTRAYDLLNQTIHFYLSKKPALALRLWRRVKELIARHYDEQQLQLHYMTGLQIIRYLLSENWIDGFANEPVASLVNNANKAASVAQWPAGKLAAVFVSIAFRSVAQSEEGQGLAILTKVLDGIGDDTHLSEFEDSLLWLKANLHIGFAVNLLDEGNIQAAIDQYAMAMKSFIGFGAQSHVIDMLNRLQDLLNDADENLLINIIVHITSNALELELVGGLRARGICQDIYRAAIAKIFSFGAANPVLLLLIVQYSKGFGFAATLDSHYRKRVQNEPAAVALLDKITALTKQIEETTAGEDVGLKTGFLDEETLLTAYVGDYGKRKGNDDQEILENLKIAFDALLYKNLMGDARNQQDFFQSPEQIQAAISPDTVLIIQYFGAGPGGEAAIYTFLVTREEIKATMGVMSGWPSANVEMTDENIAVSIPILGFLIADTRREIQEETHLGRNVTPQGRSRLIDDGNQYLGGEIKHMLEDFAKQGKNHLCIVPHSGLHFYPYHLIPVDDESILADKWAVTYLPNLKLLDPNLKQYGPLDRIADDSGTVHIGGLSMQFDEEQLAEFKAMEKKRRPIASFGLSFSDNFPHGLEALENSVTEATKIAAIFDAEPFIDKDATETAFWEALANVGMVHISSHGEHKASAPVFQCIYVYPDEYSDGIIHAYEFFGVDLRGLNLVTLSACETALGRIDPADNIRGLPAALLTAGVSTIIGTLWKTMDTACELFFTTLYNCLNQGKKKYEAFYTAQQTTRTAFPEYRHWGAFYLMGKPE